MRILLAPCLTAACMALAACNSNGDNANSDGELAPAVPTDASTPTPEPTATTSILRPDIEQPEPTDAPLVQLEPLTVTIGFPDGGSELDEDAQEAIGKVLASPQIDEGGAIILRGHSDAGGNDAVNLRVSRQRAEQVRDQLVDEGVEEDRIEVIAFGEQNPVEPNALPDGTANEEGRSANRRVELTVEVDGNEGETAGPDTDNEAEAE